MSCLDRRTSGFTALQWHIIKDWRFGHFMVPIQKVWWVRFFFSGNVSRPVEDPDRA